MNYEIKTSLDWQKVRSEIQKQSRKLPMFSHDFMHMLNAIDKEVSKISVIEIELRRQPNAHIMQKHEAQVKKVNDQLRLMMKHFTMALLRYS